MAMLCTNCRKPAQYIWTLDDGTEEPACADDRPARGVDVRDVGSEPAPVVVLDLALTVEEAAERERVSTRQVYRWLSAGELGDGAWKVNGTTGPWRIQPSALDRRRTTGPRPRVTPASPTPPAPRTSKGKAKTPTTNPASWR